MLWDPGLAEKGDEEQGRVNVPVLVPLQHESFSVEQTVPVLVPDVQDLKDQFQQQQNMLTQIKETLIQNESQLSSKGKQMEVYANKLSQIRARSKNSGGMKMSGVNPSSPKMQKKLSKESLTKVESLEGEKSFGNSSKHRKGKVFELKKCLEENKIKFEERTGKEQTETKKIETLVEQLKLQLKERDRTIQDLQKNIEEPTPKPESLPKARQKLKDSVASKTTQTPVDQPNDSSVEIIALQNKIHELEANVLDLEENLKEKESVIEARTQAVTLLSQDLSLRGKNTLESLEETRQEMRTMQNNFIAIEDQLKKDLLDRNNRLATLEEKYKKLESTNFELSLRNAEQQEKLVNLQTKYLEIDAERQSLKESMVQGQTDDKSDELTKKISVLTKELDERNKAMIKMKIEHKKRIKNFNKTLESLQEVSEEKAEIVRLSTLLEELETVKIGLENRVAELEDEKASEKELKEKINDLELIVKKQNEELGVHVKTISDLEKEKFDLVESSQEQKEEKEGRGEERLKELSRRMESMEEEYKRRVEELKGEHRKEIEMLESYYNAKGESLDRKALEEYRISAEISNIHVEEQIELLIREKQQLLEKLKSLSGVSSTDSLTFEKMEHSDLKDYREMVLPVDEEVESHGQENRAFRLEKIVSDQQHLISELERKVGEEKERVETYQQRILELETTIKGLEDANVSFKQQIEMSEVTEPGKSTKTTTNAKNRMKKIEMELTQSKKTVEAQSEKLEEFRVKLEEKEELIRKYLERMELLENQWRSAEDEMENVEELQKKCLGLEKSLLEVSEDCERLRKENIEVVHLLSEEKVKRRKLLEELEGRRAGGGWGVEERMKAMSEALEELEGKVERLEVNEGGEDGWEVRDLQEKLEWTNVVLASKETEMFGLQNLLEDRNKVVEILEADLKELRRKVKKKEEEMEEMGKELKAKEAQLEELSANFERLQDSVNATNEKTATNESQLKELLSTVKEMEGDVFRKETELQEIKGILAEKNLDMTNLRNRLEEVNSDLTYSYQEHLENMGKCLRDKESDYDALMEEKSQLEDVNRRLLTEKEEVYELKVKMTKEKEQTEVLLLEKEKTIQELKEQLKEMEKQKEEKKDTGQEKEDLKIKLKKLAANLKKKAQIEADLTQKVKELEESLLEERKQVAGLESEVKEVKEKWMMEQSEKELVRNELRAALAVKAAAESTVSEMRDQVAALEKALEETKLQHENRSKELEKQIEELECSSGRLKEVERVDKGKIFQLEAKVRELCASAMSVEQNNKEELDRERQTLLHKLSEATGKYEEMKSKYEEVVLEKSEIERKMQEVQEAWEKSRSEKSSLEAKTEENQAVIEALETELKKVGEQLKTVEEKFFQAEDRRLSLESKNEEMREKLMENSENLTAIDDLSVRIDELLRSEKFLQNSVKEMQCGNLELKQALEGTMSEKYGLERELKALSEKLLETTNELRETRSAEEEKTGLIKELNEAVERLKSEKKLLTSELERLNRDYEQFEVDFKENFENWQSAEKSLRHKIEELTNEKARLSEKCSLLEEGKEEGGEGEEQRKRKKRKSVTFRTDEAEYIKELKRELQMSEERWKRAKEEVEELREEVVRERARGEVEGVVAEAEERVGKLKGGEGVEEQSGELESLMWDDGWGAEGNLEADYLSGKGAEVRVKWLEVELKGLEAENEKLKKDLEEQAGKYAKAVKNLKKVKAGYDKLEAEAKKQKKGAEFGDLDAAIVDELKCQIEKMEAKEKELMKSLENSKLEKESLLKRIEVLNAGNEKFLEMKERQDNEVEIWQRKNSELLREVAELREKRQEAVVPHENTLLAENQELRNKVEALEWKNCELMESLEEKEELLEGRGQTSDYNMEKVIKEKSELQREIEELNNVKELLEKKLFDAEEKNSVAIEELNEQLTALASENETLQDILGQMKNSAGPLKTQEKSQSKIFDYFRSSPETDFFSVATTPTPTHINAQLPDHDSQHQLPTETLTQRLSEMEALLRQKEEKVEEARKEAEFLRRRVLEAEEEGRQRILEKEAEVECLRRSLMELETMKQASEMEAEGLMVRVRELEEAGEAEEELETIELNQGEKEAEVVRRRVAELEGLLGQKEAEAEMLEESRRVMVESLRGRVVEMEEKWGGKEAEVEVLRQRLGEVERKMLEKEEELSQVKTRASELEKSYNDSKMEIERLLNEEKLNVEEKFVEPFQMDMKIPVAFEVEALSRTLNEEKQKSENLLYELSERENLAAIATARAEELSSKLMEMEKALRESRQAETAYQEQQEEFLRVKAQLEKMVSDLQKELESSNLQLSVAQRELEEFQNVKDDAMTTLKSELFDLETKSAEAKERQQTEVATLRNELLTKTQYYEALILERREEWEGRTREMVGGLEQTKEELEREVEELRGKLEEKEREAEGLERRLQEEGSRVAEMREALEVREREVADLKETLTHLQEEIKHFRNFEKQVRDLRAAQIGDAGSETSVTAEGHPDLTDWTEHELLELSTRLQSDLDSALYMLHQRDVRCDELTFELMQLLEERDTLQLRLSTALRINEGLRSVPKPEAITSACSLQESKDLVDQSNDRQQERSGEDLRLASKISELHSVGYLRDKSVKEESVQRHKEQMNLLSRVSDSDLALSRDSQSSPTVLLNWMRGKTTPKVMHI